MAPKTPECGEIEVCALGLKAECEHVAFGGGMIAAVISSVFLASASPVVAKLLDEYFEQNGICRGTYGEGSDIACKKRDELVTQPGENNYCYGKKSDQAMADMSWHECTGDSIQPTQKDTYEFGRSFGTTTVDFDGITADMSTRLDLYSAGGDKFSWSDSTRVGIGLSFTCRRSKPSKIFVNVVRLDPIDEWKTRSSMHQDIQFTSNERAVDAALFTSVKSSGFGFVFSVKSKEITRVIEDMYDNKKIVFDLTAAPEFGMAKFIIDPNLSTKVKEKVGRIFQMCETMSLFD
ncbi:hypothetical protein [Mesorhizobium sp. A623]